MLSAGYAGSLAKAKDSGAAISNLNLIHIFFELNIDFIPGHPVYQKLALGIFYSIFHLFR